MKKSLVIVILLLFSAVIFAQQTDVITLKNGNVIRGRIVEQTSQLVKVYTANRSIVELKPDEIQSMTKEGSTSVENAGMPSEEDATTQGNMIVGGSGWIGFDKYKYSSTSETKYFNISISPSVAWFVVDYLAVGAEVDLGISTHDKNTTLSVGIGPLVKYYLEGGLFFSLQAAIAYDHYPTKNTNTSFSIKPGFGYAIFLNPKLALEPALTYRFESSKYKTAAPVSTSTTKITDLGLEVGLTKFF